jgi:magnesium transporter
LTDRTDLQELIRIAESGDVEAFCLRAELEHPSDIADALVALDADVRLALVRALPVEIASEALAEMEPEEHPEEVLAALTPEDAANIVDELEDDDAADLIQELPRDTATFILASVDDREDIEKLLEYPEESAGGIMTTALVSVPDQASAAAAIESIRDQSIEVGEFYQVYCTDSDGLLVGVLALRALVIAPANALVSEIMEPAPARALPEEDQEEVARLMARYNLASVPVVDADGRLLGRVTFDDVIDVVEAEQTEDLLKFGGVLEDEELSGPWRDAVKSRLPWLYLNLLTASLSAGVVGLFREAVESIWALAALVPVVAALGGSAGTQALAVTVRRVSLGQLPAARARLAVKKEVFVGLANGLVVGLGVGLASVALGSTWIFGAIVLVSMWGNLAVAGFFGSAVPLILERLGKDPAVASSVFVTAFTDVFGYFLLFGLATWFVL